jgi:hypothetical protein
LTTQLEASPENKEKEDKVFGQVCEKKRSLQEPVNCGPQRDIDLLREPHRHEASTQFCADWGKN